MAAGLAKSVTWVIRLFQLFFAIILMGIASYMIHEFHEYDWTTPKEVILPEVASVLATFISVFSIIAICFLGRTLQMVAAFLDFAAFVLYLVSSVLLRHNYHENSIRNPLRNSLVYMRQINGDSPRVNRTNGLVKMLVAGCVIQTLLFFITTLLQVYILRRDNGRPIRSRHAV